MKNYNVEGCENFDFKTELLKSLNENDDDQIESAIAKWGCKWDIDNDAGLDPHRADPNTVTLCFETPWSPPTVFYQSMMEDYGYGVDAKYFEPGMGFAGYWINGDDIEYQVKEKCIPYDNTGVKLYVPSQGSLVIKGIEEFA